MKKMVVVKMVPKNMCKNDRRLKFLAQHPSLRKHFKKAKNCSAVCNFENKDGTLRVDMEKA